MLREKEGVENDVDLQEGTAVENHPVALVGQQSAALQFVELRAELLLDIDLELRGEIALGNSAELELENQLPDQAFFSSGLKCAANRQISAPYGLGIALEVRQVLEMHATE